MLGGVGWDHPKTRIGDQKAKKPDCPMPANVGLNFPWRANGKAVRLEDAHRSPRDVFPWKKRTSLLVCAVIASAGSKQEVGLEKKIISVHNSTVLSVCLKLSARTLVRSSGDAFSGWH